MKTAIAEIKRPNGKIEIVELPQPHPSRMSAKGHFNALYTATKNAGRGEFLRVTVTETIKGGSNIQSLIREYNDTHNEGGEGYLPEIEFFEKMDTFKKYDDIITTTVYTK